MEDTRAQYARIEERLKALAEKLDAVDERLFGNGQPGILDKLNTRITLLEKKFWISFGGGIVVVTLIGWAIAIARANPIK